MPLSDILAERGCRHPYILVKGVVLVELELKCWKGGALVTAPEKYLTFHSAKLMIEFQRQEIFSNTKSTTFHSSSDEQITIHHR